MGQLPFDYESVVFGGFSKQIWKWILSGVDINWACILPNVYKLACAYS